MPIKITVLSGGQQDEVIECDQRSFSIGHSLEDDLRFHLDRDPEVRGQSIRLQLEGDRWILHNRSKGPLFINQDMVEGSAAIRSGDIIRMSYDGPDLLLELLSKQSQSPSIKSAPIESANTTGAVEQADCQTIKTASNTVSCAPEEPQLIEPATIQTSPVTNRVAKSGKRKKKSNTAATIFTFLSIPAGGFAGICIAIVLLWVVWKKDPLGLIGPSDNSGLQSPSELDFRSERDTGAIINGQQNVDAENQPEEENRRGSPDQSKIKSRSRNRSPILGSIPTQEIDLSEKSFLRFRIPASDPDQPEQSLRFYLRPGAPDNVRLDPNTGDISWEIDADHPSATVSIPFQVSDDGMDSLSVQGDISVNIVPADRWKIVENDLLKSLYLIVAQPSLGALVENSELRTTYLALGTGIAVDANHLLTSATVAKALAEAKSKGWQLNAYSPNSKLEEEPQRYQIRTMQVHAIYANATAIADKYTRQLTQAYFDLAVLTLDHETPSHCKLGIVAYPLPATEEAACIGFSVEGTPTSNPGEAVPFFSRVNLIDAIPPPNQPPTDSKPPLLLQLSGQVADHPYGSLIVNDRGDVIGVYGFRGELPQELAHETVHYAAEVTQAMAFLKGNGLDFWVSEDAAETGSSDP